MQIPRPRESQPEGDSFSKAIERFIENLQKYRGRVTPSRDDPGPRYRRRRAAHPTKATD